MEHILKFKTNINCKGCLSKVIPVLDQSEGICQWDIDLDDQDKILSLTSVGITAEEVIQKIDQAGYTAQEIK